MKRILTILLMSCLSLTINAQDEHYAKVRVYLDGIQMSQVSRLGIDLEGIAYRPGAYFDAELSNNDIQKIAQQGLRYEVLIPNMSAFYRERLAAESGLPVNRNLTDLYPVPQNWGYGTMGGFYTYDQVLAKLDFMAQQWPNLITVKQPVSGGALSHEGRPTWFVKISDNPNVQEDEPQVLYTSVIHAREGIGVQQMMYYMLYLLENYETNDEAKYLVDHTEMYFIPISNPDGYLYNESTDPNGGGMWRKNRRNNGGSYGVDVNRNFGYMWGLDDEGSSGVPSDETYRGPSAFSEPESSNLKLFCEQHDFKIALNYHSYSNLLLYPWGYTDIPCPDDAIFNVHASLMTRDNNYVYGAGSTTIYPTNGASDDYMYGDTQNKNKIFSYTPECGNSNDGFWPAQSRIIPLCQENMIQNIMAAYLAGNYGKLTEKSPAIIEQTNAQIHFDLQRLGFGDSQGWTVSIEPIDDHIVSVGDSKVFGSLAMLETVSDSISIALDPEILSGTAFQFLLKLDNGSFVLTDTISKIYGQSIVIFEDNCDNSSKWSSPKWAATTADYHSAPGSITDSPGTEYNNNETNIITLAQPIELGVTPFAQLSFWAKWNIEAGYDYVQLEVKKEGTSTWIPLEGKYTKPGTNDQAAGEPLYDGVSGWVKEQVDLSAYSGESIRLRFMLKSDVYVTADGFYFDDMSLMVLDTETGINESKPGSSLQLSLSPNPANMLTTVGFNPAQQGTSLRVVDLQGRTVYQTEIAAGSRQMLLDVSSWNKGVYVLTLTDSARQERLKLVVR